MNPHLTDLIADFRHRPSHTGALIVTLMGDSIMPRGGAVALSTILDLCAALDIGAGVVRTAISRLAADGWMLASRQSRASFYEIGPGRRGEFVRAARHIFGPPRRPEIDRLTLVLLEAADNRDKLRARLTRLGFVAVQNVMIAPQRPLPPSVTAAVVAVIAEAPGDTLFRLATRAWRLDRLATLYAAFIARFTPLAAARLVPVDALLARTLLIHDYRHIMLRDPRLPRAFLPPAWIGDEARILCARLYARLRPPSEAWLDRHATTRDGTLPPPDATLDRRFADTCPVSAADPTPPRPRRREPERRSGTA